MFLLESLGLCNDVSRPCGIEGTPLTKQVKPHPTTHHLAFQKEMGQQMKPSQETTHDLKNELPFVFGFGVEVGLVLFRWQ